MEELKKCPFCDGEASLKVNHGFGEEVISAFVYCEECGVATRNCALESTARGMWNRRSERMKEQTFEDIMYMIKKIV